MDRLIEQLRNYNFRELFFFVISGCCAVAIDALVYFLLIRHIGYEWAKGGSFLAGTIVAFILNKSLTFGVKGKLAKRLVLFLGLYLCSLLVNTGINSLILKLSRELSLTSVPDAVCVIIAFGIATACSMVLNFCGQKWVVFRK